MFMLPTCKNTSKDQISQEVSVGAKMELDESAYDVLKEPLGCIAGEPSLPAIGSPSASSCPSASFPTSTSAGPLALNMDSVSVVSGAGGQEEIADDDLQDLSTNVKRSENLLKVGLAQLPPMKDHYEDMCWMI